MSRRLVVDWVDWQEDAETLRQRYLHEPVGEVRTRLHALWLLRTGRPALQVAADLGVSERTVRHWAAWYRQGQLPEVVRRRNGGVRTPTTPCRLTPEQQAALREWTRQGTCFRVADAQAWVLRQCGVPYSYWGMWALLHRLQLRPKRPRPLAKRADPQAQAAWREGAPHGACPGRSPALGRDRLGG